ncbi:methyl-accepting chemotaxis protein [Thiospirochaeta perfilievii]|uniref:Methyl-accepting chemotaxis protein n=1 Tax=Thiospirochaeta perfilievii TaxID=252967 RepID=A0A5C1QEY3_9SPIO|nr:methyl-accepting chemotaxis protein [Thiospirochaeta perfilievii]QEN05957.1 methyl-accepting chemotaxis protein [Thiospirochaeta perfilievii]
MSIKSKLMLYIGGTLSVLLVFSFSILIYLSYIEIKDNLDIEMNNESTTITKQVSDLINTSAKSYLMGVGNSALVISQNFKGDNKEQLISDLVKIRFLKTGFIFITDEKGIIIGHPNKDLIGTISPMLSWLQRLKHDENEFKEYDELNRNKLVYRVYDTHLGINICVSAYTSEFINAVDLKELNKTMNNIKIGKSGYPFLIGYDGRIITHPNRELLHENGNELITKIVESKSGFILYNWRISDEKIREKYVKYKNDKNSEIIVAVTGYIDEAYRTLHNQIKLIIIIGSLVLIVVLLLITLVSSKVTTPLNKFTDKFKDISIGQGDLTQRMEVKSGDELGIMAEYFNKFLDNLQKIVNSVKNSSLKTMEIKNRILSDVDETSIALSQINSNVNRINGQTDDLFINVNSSALCVTTISKDIKELNSSINKQVKMFDLTSLDVSNMIESISNVLKITEFKQESTKKLVEKSLEGGEIINKTLIAVKEVSSKVSSIKNMAEVITNIASQTNLLSINAAIEAAHAGDSGKGFAVVANEIGKLADSSSKNSVKISSVIKDIEKSIIATDDLSHKTSDSFNLILSEINELVETLDSINKRNRELNNDGKSALSSINELNSQSHLVMNMINSIKNESDEVKSAMDKTKVVTTNLVSGVKEISISVKGITESIDGHKSTTVELEENSLLLDKQINKFKSYPMSEVSKS